MMYIDIKKGMHQIFPFHDSPKTSTNEAITVIQSIFDGSLGTAKKRIFILSILLYKLEMKLAPSYLRRVTRNLLAQVSFFGIKTLR